MGGIFLLHFPSDCSAWTLSSTGALCSSDFPHLTRASDAIATSSRNLLYCTGLGLWRLSAAQNSFSSALAGEIQFVWDKLCTTSHGASRDYRKGRRPVRQRRRRKLRARRE